MRRTLAAVKEQLQKRRHDPLGTTGRWLASVVRGWLGYYSVPGNFRCLDQFITEVTKLWLRQIRRRSQRGRSRWTWSRMDRLSKKHLPRARIQHPYPGIRFHARLGAGAV
jgi:RNA-directed DNA polymerase